MQSLDPHTIERRLQRAEALTVGARVGVVLLFAWGAWASQQALGDVDRARHVMQTIEQVRQYQLVSHLHSRGFLLSRDSAEARSMVRAMRLRDSALTQLESLTADNAASRARVAALGDVLDTADAVGAAVRHAAATSGADSVSRLLHAHGRVNYPALVNARFDEVLRGEEVQLVASTTRQRRAINLTLIAAGIGAVLAAAFGLTTLRSRRRNTRDIAADALSFRRLAEDNPDGVLVHIGYQVVYANPAIDTMLRTAGRSLLSRNVRDIIHPDERDVIDQRTTQVASDGLPTPPRQIRFLRDDGDVCEVEARGASILFGGLPAIQVVVRDLSARRDAERALFQSEQRFRAVLDAMDEGVVLHHADLSIGLSNPAAQRILGLSADQLAGRTPSDPSWRTISPDGAPLPPEQHFASIAMRTGRPASGVMGVERHGHERVWINVNAIPLLPDGETAPAGVVATFADITARLALEDQLRQAQKMEVMGRMASGVAHDFNNLLTIIRSASELLRIDASRAGIIFDALDDIESATDRAVALTAHLLTFSRRQHAAPSLLCPAVLVADALPILRRLGGDGVSVEYETNREAERAWIWADPVRFEQVLVNLVSNAKDAMPSGGTVRVQTNVVTLSQAVTHRFGAIAAGTYATLAVEDSGTGMTGEVLDHLFDPFYTTKPQGRGTGLGLSIVYGVVHEALGTITVDSEPGRGSRLTVYWPKADAAEPTSVTPSTKSFPEAGVVGSRDTAAQPMREATSMPATVGTDASGGAMAGDLILLVDDEVNVRRVVAKQLESDGYVVITADSGRSALAMLRNEAFDIRVVVSDVRMPEMTGLELVEAMAAEQIDRPVLLVSGQLDTQLPRAWPADTIVRFLPKPLSGMALRRAVRELITLAPRRERMNA
jgi:two-component system cell cycle sensor histidine kinase/response regulator CckA